MTTMTELTIEQRFEAGFKRYDAGESPDALLPEFIEICRLDPKNAAAWSCVAWLHLLRGKADLALPAAQRSVKIDHRNPQAHVNLALALLGTGGKGVRKHIELVQKVMDFSEEVRQDIFENIDDGLTRRPDWKELAKVKNWLSE
jgi:tetratricopeptide (TPR) repeat protein